MRNVPYTDHLLWRSIFQYPLYAIALCSQKCAFPTLLPFSFALPSQNGQRRLWCRGEVKRRRCWAAGAWPVIHRAQQGQSQSRSPPLTWQYSHLGTISPNSPPSSSSPPLPWANTARRGRGESDSPYAPLICTEGWWVCMCLCVSSRRGSINDVMMGARTLSRLRVCPLPDFTGIFWTFLLAQWAQLVCKQIK